MGYVFMFLWIVFLIAFVVMGAIWLKKRTQGKLVLGSLALSIACLVIGVVVISNQPVATSSSDRVMIDATQFSRVSPDELINIMGTPESIEEWKYTVSDTRSYDATTYYYNKDQYEFLIIDNMVVRFTFNGEKVDHNEFEFTDMVRMFGIKIESDLIKVADNSTTRRYKNISDKVVDFWVTYLSDSTVYKITYDNDYF